VKLHKIYLEDLDVMVNDSAQVADSLRGVECNRLLGTVSSVLRALGREYRCHRHFPVQINAYRLAPHPSRTVLM
jgi:hypothetical protein